jgi:triacylglycerol lipase
MKYFRSALVVAALAAAAVACTTPPAPGGGGGGGGGGTPSGDHNPVVFVHGYVETPSMWNTAIAQFKAAGYTNAEIGNYGFNTTIDSATKSAVGLAKLVDQVLARTGKQKVDIMAHSLGNLVTKACIVEGGCANKVEHWANVSGANNGTNIAYGCTGGACEDMRPTSALVNRLKTKSAVITQQGVKVQVHWTPTDSIILPPSNTKETFAENIQVSGMLNHLNISMDRGVIQDTIKFFAT